MCIFVLEHCSETCWVWTFSLGSAGIMSVLRVSATECFPVKPSWKTPLGSDCPHTIANSWHQAGDFSEQKLPLDRLPKRASPRILGMPLTNRELPVLSTLHRKHQFVLQGSFQCWDTEGKYAGENQPIWVCWNKVFSPCLWKRAWFLSKTPQKTSWVQMLFLL